MNTLTLHELNWAELEVAVLNNFSSARATWRESTPTPKNVPNTSSTDRSTYISRWYSAAPLQLSSPLHLRPRRFRWRSQDMWLAVSCQTLSIHSIVKSNTIAASSIHLRFAPKDPAKIIVYYLCNTACCTQCTHIPPLVKIYPWIRTSSGYAHVSPY